jgi:putative transposase
MARRARIVLAEVPHHVILRGNNKRRLFSYPHEYNRFLYAIGRALRPAKCLLHALVLMTNHVHLIVTPMSATALGFFVKTFGQRYAQQRNARRHASGRLFEERYHSAPILSERQLAVTTAYVELNPVRAGMVEDPMDYQWSTYRLHAGHHTGSAVSPFLWTPSCWYQSLGRQWSDRGSLFVSWVAECRARDERPETIPRRVLEEIEREQARDRCERPDRSSAR